MAAVQFLQGFARWLRRWGLIAGAIAAVVGATSSLVRQWLESKGTIVAIAVVSGYALATLLALYLWFAKREDGTPKFGAGVRRLVAGVATLVHAGALFLFGYLVGDRSRARVIASMDYVVLTSTEPVARECNALPPHGLSVQLNWRNFATDGDLVLTSYVDAKQEGLAYFFRNGLLVQADGWKADQATGVDLLFVDGFQPMARPKLRQQGLEEEGR